jgi:hypothetical protein
MAIVHQTSGPKIAPQPSRTTGRSVLGSQHQKRVGHRRRTLEIGYGQFLAQWTSDGWEGCEPGAAADRGRMFAFRESQVTQRPRLLSFVVRARRRRQ